VPGNSQRGGVVEQRKKERQSPAGNPGKMKGGSVPRRNLGKKAPCEHADQTRQTKAEKKSGLRIAGLWRGGGDYLYNFYNGKGVCVAATEEENQKEKEHAKPEKGSRKSGSKRKAAVIVSMGQKKKQKTGGASPGANDSSQGKEKKSQSRGSSTEVDAYIWEERKKKTSSRSAKKSGGFESDSSYVPSKTSP